MKDTYRKQVQLLLDVLPEVAKEACFAMHGGTAINLFYRDMPRLSVDIDLTCVPIADRAESLVGINQALQRMQQNIYALRGSIQVQHRADVCKLQVTENEVLIKLEVNMVGRGLIADSVKMPLCDMAQEAFDAFCALVNYAYCDRNEDGDGILAVLAMTNDRPHPLHDGQVCATAIPPGLDAAFLLSPHLLLDWIIRPALASLYPIGNPADLVLEDNPPRLVLPAAIDIPAVEENGQSYPARLTKLSVVFSGNALRCESEVCLEKEALFDYTHVRSRHQLVVEHDAAGKPHILFVEAVPPVVTQSSEMKASFIRKTSNIANAVLLVGTALAFLITGPIGATIMLLSVTTYGIFRALPALEYYLDRTEPHPVDLLSLNATSVFAWAGGETFALESVSLVESLRLEGTPWSAPE